MPSLHIDVIINETRPVLHKWYIDGSARNETIEAIPFDIVHIPNTVHLLD